MNPTLYSRLRHVLAVIAVAVLVFGGHAMRQVFRQAYNGFICDPAGNIVKVFERGPAETAGFRVGDVIASVEGVEFRDVRGRLRLPVPKIGDAATIVVERGGAKHTLHLTHSAPPARDLALAVSHALIGLCFLVAGLFAYFRVQTRSTLLLAVVGLCFGLRLMTLYYLPQGESDSVRMVWLSAFEASAFLGLAASLHLALAFPQPGAFLRNKVAVLAIYLPAIAVTLMLAFLNTAVPDATPRLMSAVNTIYGLCWVAYLLAIAIVLVRTYLKTGREDRVALGIKAMVLGTVVGVAPMLLVFVALVLAPSVWLPGSEFSSLPAILIPFAWSAAILKAEAKLATLPVTPR